MSTCGRTISSIQNATHIILIVATVASLCTGPAFAQSQTASQIRKQQEALIWTTDYEGLVDGKIGEGTLAAIKKFQARIGHPATGQLTSLEEGQLLQEGRARRTQAGFRQLTDNEAGVSVGIPLGLVQGPTETKWGNHWYSKKNGLLVETLRFGTEVSLKDLFDRLLKINDRKVAYQRFVENTWFVIAAFEGKAAVYVRADVVTPPNQPSEIRGFSVWMSKDRPAEYQAIPPAMLSSFRSNTDRKNDASSNETVGSAPPTVVNPPPVVIQTSKSAVSVLDCYKGLGDCPAAMTPAPVAAFK
ncbi:peptidoglycan-binding domain-containing protein [Bradyrhizobium sp. CCBAU 65884]|uniref:peptidoglycan-binding domain-containing protein n=1 Tax=Bradyrhizobium sp. CCBAU 65884 TaxID=722477 RepID=UPI0023060E43|nr:peptidoglycan-binding domain-containing protein [Bradyrhizobium sp. CCBAU 65884]